MTEISVFLKAAKLKSAQFDSTGESRLKVVLGNSACDLDSAACTLAVAIFRNLRESKEENIIPVFNICREDMEYRTEILHFFKKMNVSLDDLIYRPDIEDMMKEAMNVNRLEVILVDHHYDPALNRAVKEIFDHRTVQAEIARNISATIKPVGSCATLITQHLATEPDIFKSMLLTYREVMEMCLGAILLDTVNFSKQTDRFTDLDEDMVKLIEEGISETADHCRAREALYSELLDARNDVSNLTPYQQLRKDFKMVSSLPVCGLTMLVQEFVLKYHPDAEKALEEFAAKTGSTEVVLMGRSTIERSAKRDLGFYSAPNSPIFLKPDMPIKRLEDQLSKLEEPNFKLNHLKFPINGFPSLKIYWQHNVKLTRKHLIPAIKVIQEMV